MYSWVKAALTVKSRLYSLASAFLVIVQVLAMVAVLERPAQAYVDPGSGLLAFQIAGSMVAGVAYYLRARIAQIFHKTELDSEEKDLAEVQTSGKHS
jgi:hypothetical protein